MLEFFLWSFLNSMAGISTIKGQELNLRMEAVTAQKMRLDIAMLFSLYNISTLSSECIKK